MGSLSVMTATEECILHELYDTRTCATCTSKLVYATCLYPKFQKRIHLVSRPVQKVLAALTEEDHTCGDFTIVQRELHIPLLWDITWRKQRKEAAVLVSLWRGRCPCRYQQFAEVRLATSRMGVGLYKGGEYTCKDIAGSTDLFHKRWTPLSPLR